MYLYKPESNSESRGSHFRLLTACLLHICSRSRLLVLFWENIWAQPFIQSQPTQCYLSVNHVRVPRVPLRTASQIVRRANNGQLGSFSNSRSITQAGGTFSQWRKGTSADDRNRNHFELSVAVNSVTETRNEGAYYDSVQVVHLPPLAAAVCPFLALDDSY